MEQLLLHLFGDYILQNDNIGTRKKEKTWTGFLYCIFHCVVYSLPFLLITGWKAVVLIGVGHFLVDRFNWLVYFIKTKNFVKETNNFGYKESRPFPITIWLYIIQDNTIHLVWNYLIIYICK